MSATFGLGGDARVACGTGMDNVDTGTIAAWLRMPTSPPGTTATVITKHSSDFRCNISATGQLAFRRGGTGALNSLALATEFAHFGTAKWLFAGWEFAFAGANPTIWVGDETHGPAEPASYIVQNPGSGTPDDNAAETIYLGNDSGFALGFGDDIHSIAVYGQVLTPGQLDALRFAMAAGAGESLEGGSILALASWVLSHTGTITDQSGNGNDGTPTNVTAEADAPAPTSAIHKLTGLLAGPLTGKV